MDDNGDSWSKGLKYVIYGMNTSKSPYQIVFGQEPWSNCSVLEQLTSWGIRNEEDTGDHFIKHPSESTDTEQPDFVQCIRLCRHCIDSDLQPHISWDCTNHRAY